MEMTLERARELAADVLLDETCPQGHRGSQDGLFERVDNLATIIYCSECDVFYAATQLTLEPMELVPELEVV